MNRCALPVLLLVTVLLAAPAAALRVDDVFPLEPADGARVGAKPMMKIGVEGDDIREMKFRILLSRDGFDTIAYTLDEKSDFAYVIAGHGIEQPGALYYGSTRFEPGLYEWKASAWDGLQWIDSSETFEMMVDTIPPALVEGVRASWDREAAAVMLEWDPVFVDAEGQPEEVARYHVYRFDYAFKFAFIRANKLAVTADTFYLDTSEKVPGAATLFYKINAEDVAGNERGAWQLRRVGDPPRKY